MSESELIDQVDEDNKVIGQVVRGEAHAKGLLHRAVHIWVYSPTGKVLVQKRSQSKNTDPGKLDASVGGHVKAGDSLIEAAVSEAAEEIGVQVDASALSGVGVVKVARSVEGWKFDHVEFLHLYVLELPGDTEFSFPDGEVQEVSWMSFDKFSKISSDERLKSDFVLQGDEYYSVVIKEIKSRLDKL